MKVPEIESGEMSGLLSLIDSSIKESLAAKEALLKDRELLDALARVGLAIRDSFLSGGRVYIMGNGGSAADAEHIAAEFAGKFERQRAGLPCIALTTNTAALTAIGNDYSFEF